jgi:hypothetical protein
MLIAIYIVALTLIAIPIVAFTTTFKPKIVLLNRVTIFCFENSLDVVKLTKVVYKFLKI